MYWLLSPLSWLLLAGVVLAWALLRRRLLLTLGAGTVVALALVAMTPLAANLLARPLERPFLAANGCSADPASVAVVLGGGISGSPRDAADFSVLNLASRRRVDRAVEWWREGEGRVLVMQGGAPYRSLPALAELMAAYARMQGVPSGALRVETGSGDTRENAAGAAAMTPPLPRRVVLVTSMIHMRRAQEVFRRNGFDVCPLGTDRRRLPSRIPWALIPRTSALANTEVALHEWAGLAYYRLHAERQPTPGTR
ncbi:YdcF family protein [Lysobacter solisilvae (ex Woo and Kim 2020)]|uniref:YdcF family protein n=1 Tax=Agrilutibacter terrestris TaxID=2865112 RepID=A0A7H0FXC3_9GAMM|nr:YdcF family protein [Lysobacter terrestris]QNP40689.1 YdcF family protein [Lysobacter terrestris]